MSAQAIGVLIVASDVDTMCCRTHAVLCDPGLRLIAATRSRSSAIALLDATAPDVLLVDLDAEAAAQREGIELLRDAGRRHPCCDSLVVASDAGDAQAIAAIGAGAAGCLLRQNASPERIAAAIHELRTGGAPLDPLVARSVLSRFRGGGGTPVPPPAGALPTLLTRRETEILRLTAKGLVFETIGSLLDISPHTVIAHARKIYQKLDVHSRSAAVYATSRSGLL